jgi:hypothetical protein
MAKIIIINSAVTWNTIKQRFQHLAENLSIHPSVEKVLYIEPYCPFPAVFKDQNLKKIYPLFGRSRVINPGLKVITPPRIFLPFPNNFIPSHIINQFLLAFWLYFIFLRERIRSDKKNSPLFIHHQLNYYLIKFFKNSSHIFDYVDNNSAFSWVNKKVTLYLEKRMMLLSHAVVCTAQMLKKKAQVYNKRCFFIPNGSDLIIKHQNINEDNELFQKIKNLTQKNRKKNILNLAYIGCISDWFDWPAIKKLVEKKDICIHIFGPELRNRNMPGWVLKSRTIFFHGTIIHENIPSYLTLMDASLIPFVKNDVTQCTNPVKLYDYLSSGIPVIASAIAELKGLNKIIGIYNNSSELYDKVIDAVKNNSPEKEKKRKDFARKSTWYKRSRDFMFIIDKL